MDNISLITTPTQLWDSEDFFNLSKQPDIRKEFPNMRFTCKEDAEMYLENRIAETKAENPNFFKMIKIFFGSPSEPCTKENSILIGFIAMHNVGMMDQVLNGGMKQNISFAISSSYRGRGFMTIALEMMIEAMIDGGYTYISALVKSENIASKKVLQKCGFMEIRELPYSSTFIKRLAMSESSFLGLIDKLENFNPK